MATYVRQSSFSDGDTITAALFNNEFNQLVNAFDVATGHTHDGSTAGDGGPLSNLFSNALVFGTNTNNDIAITFNATSNDGVLTWMEDEDYFKFSDDILLTTTEKVQFRDTAIYINSSTDGQLDIVADTEIQIAATTIDINGNADISGNLGVGGNLTVTGTTTFNGGTITMGDAATDNVVFGADVDSNIIPDDDDSYDLGSSTQEWRNLYIDGTANIDSLVADTADINGGTIDAANITVGSGKTLDVSAGTLTLADNQISGDKVEGGTINATTINTLTYGSITDGTITVTAFVDEDNMASNSATLIPTQQSVKAYVDAQDTAQDLDLVSDSGTIAIDLDGETLTVTGGEGIDTSASSNTLTITGEDATTSNKGIASFNSDDFNVSSGAVTLATTSTAAELNLLDGTTAGTIVASKGVAVDANKDITGFRNITLTGELDAGSLDISGNVDIDGTLEADAITIAGVTLAETISDTVGAMVASNTETGITVTYDDADNTLDFVIGADAIVQSMIADDAIDSQMYVDGSIDLVHMSANSVDSDQYVDGSIDTAHIADSQITSAKIVDGTIATGDIADDAVTGAKLANNIDIAGTLDVTGVLTADSNVVIAGNLTVQGDTTTLNTATLDVEDKNITLNKGAGDTSGSANGAGLTIQDAVDASNDATILWDTTNDEFDFSHPINVAGKVTSTGTSVFASLDISGDIDVDGTTNLDVVDIDGAVQLDNTLTVGVDDTGYDVKFFGAASGGYTEWDESASLWRQRDGVKSVYGNGDDLQIYHTGTHSFLSNTTGNMYIQDDSYIELGSPSGEVYIGAVKDGAVNLRYDNVTKLATASGGITVTGVVTATSLDISGDIDVDGTTNLDVVDIDGAVDMASTLAVGGLTTVKSDASGYAIKLVENSGSEHYQIGIDQYGGLAFYNETTKVAEFNDASGFNTYGNVIFNEDSADVDFRVESDVNANSIFVNGADGGISFGTTVTNMASNHNNVAGLGVGNDGKVEMATTANVTALEVSKNEGTDGAVLYMRKQSTGFATHNVSSGNYLFGNPTSDKDVIITGNDGGSIINALTLDMSAAGTAIFNHDIELADSALLRMGAGGDFIATSDGSNALLYANNGNFVIDSAGEIYLDADGADIIFQDAGAEFGRISKGGGSDLVITASIADKDIFLTGTDGSTAITALTLDMSNAGAATFNSTIAATSATFTPSSGETVVISRDSAGPYFGNSSNNSLRIITNNATRINISNSGNISTHPPAGNHFVINEDGIDSDFRVESDGNANMLFVDGGNNRVGIGATGGSQTGSNFYVEGRTSLYNGSVTGGSVLITDAYTPSTNDHILNIGTQRSSGGPFISYGLGHAQNSDALWKSTYDNFDGSHSVLVLNGSTLEYYLDASNSQTTVGDTVAVKNGYKVGRSGTVFNDDGYSEFDFRVASDAYSNCIHVNAGDNSVTFHKSVQSVSTSGFTIGIPSAGVTSSMPSGNTYHVYRSDGVDNGYKFYVNFGGQILSTSTSISGLSDERLKENIVDLETGLTEVIALKPRRFDWKGNGNKNVAGFIAQEVETVLPELLGDFLHDDLADAKSVKMGDMVPTLVKAIQEQQTLIESLTARIAALEE
jgi:cytoskeletal protein CcmA (bactofilin family)